MTTDPGDLVLDITCGSGTTAYVAEQWGRRWVTCDTSRVATTLAKQRLMTASFDYYKLQRPELGISNGFEYKTVPHVTLKSIANNPEIREGMSRVQIDAAIKKYAIPETLYDQPLADNTRVRVTGPFTVEAVPAPMVHPLHEIPEDVPADASAGRSGETLRQSDWRGELLKGGIRAKGGNILRFSRVEALPGTRWISAEGETQAGDRVVFCFGPEHAPLEQRQVEMALNEAESLRPKPKMVVFAAFQFDPEAAKDIDETKWPGMTLLKAQMNTDLLTNDLKKKRSGDQAFWLVGQPDVKLERAKGKVKSDDKNKWRVSVHGFDYYNPKTGEMESGGTSKIAMWLLDTDYDGRSLFPRQVFFPMAGEKEGWARLARNLKAEIDEERIEAYRGTESLLFEAGQHSRVAVKIVDDRGIESLRVMEIEG
jgi:adenine-specific DNA-methyltransferase